MVNLSNIKRKITTFLWMLLFFFDFFGDAVISVVERFQESTKQEEAVT